MGQRGPAPMPENVRQLRGNPGKRHTNVPVAVHAIPEAPEWLSDEARGEWERVTPELERLGIIAQIDRGILTSYCEAWSIAVAARNEIGNEILIQGRDKGQVRNPALQVFKDATNIMASTAKELGLSPNARMRMLAPKPDFGEDDDLD